MSSILITRVTKTVMIANGNNTLCDTKPAPTKKAKAAISMNTMMLNESSRKAEDKMATMFMGIVVVFIACHLPRSEHTDVLKFVSQNINYEV